VFGPQAETGERPPRSRELHRLQLHAAAILGTGLLAALLLLIDWRSPLRVVVALVFLLFGPGLAVAELLSVRDLAQRLALATGVSLAVETLVGLALLYAGAYSAGLTFAIVLALTAAVLAAAFVRVA
jgi:uncharacterized membrane protein